jgi:outer membrane cobalamin receptor
LQPLHVVLLVAPVEETVVVTATRTEMPSSQVGASMTIFTAADLAGRRQPLVADLLRASPGATLVRSGGIGAQTSLFVRGGESNYNKVLLDGIPLNEPGGTFNFSNLTTENLDRVEIVRGAHSALFGSDAMASVVQLFTKRGPHADGPRVSAILDGGTYDTVHASLLATGGSDRLDYALGAARFTTDNRVPNNAFENTTLTANVGAALGGHTTLRAVARGELELVGTPGQTSFGRPDLDAFFKRDDAVVGVTLTRDATTRFRERATYSYAASTYTSTNLLVDPPYTPQFGGHVAPFELFDYPFDSRTALRRHHATYQADLRLADGGASGDQLLTTLVDWDGERAALADRLAAATTEASRNNVGWSIQQQALWPRVFVTAGARIEHNASFGMAAVPRGSVVFIAREQQGTIGETAIKASVGLGIKEPTILQSYSTSPFFLGNPDLRPERSRSLEAGIEQRLMADRAKIELTWFTNRYRDIISTRTTSFNPFRAQYFNIGLTRARGMEAAVTAAPTPALSVRGGYTFLDSEILESTSPTNVVFASGQWAFRRPRHSGFVGIAWKRQRVSADVTGLFIGRSVDSDFSSLEPPLIENVGHATWDARASYQLTPRLAAVLSLDNLTNQQYMEPLGYPALGRAVRAGIRMGL